ncbi:NAD-dependent protein lipoamidase sirtuin-4 [Chytridiales sp. JEL 0842]|nr:NAD-dependent protein lipoamidase sirtuin-4 [Chytridiales sp. JEL 0842]
MGKPAFRQRYWARSYLGWPRIMKAQPNETHHAIRELQKGRFIDSGVITQNVDGLHGSDNVLELHGTLHKVHCTSCSHTLPRSEFQQILTDLNPLVADWARRNPNQEGADVASSVPRPSTTGERNRVGATVNPDGDVEVTWDYSQFRYPDCLSCGVGVYKPSVVFFGENIPPRVRDESFHKVNETSGLLIVGSSLTVYSAFRLLKRAHEREIPIGILNLGEPRGANLADFWVEAKSDVVMPKVVQALNEHCEDLKRSDGMGSFGR